MAPLLPSLFNRLVSKAVAPVVQDAARKVDTAEQIALGQDQALFKGVERFDTIPMAVVVSSDPKSLLQMVKTGEVRPSFWNELSIGNVTLEVQSQTGKAALVLSSEGKQALAMGGKLDALVGQSLNGVLRDGLRFGVAKKLPQALEFNRRYFKVLLVDEKVYPQIVQMYQEAIAKGEATSQIEGRHYLDFIRPSDDLYNDLQVEAFQQAVPGFADRPLSEQRSVAAMASKVVAKSPPEVDENIRRRVAANLISYEPVVPTGEGPLPPGQVGPIAQPAAKIRTFYHGRGRYSNRDAKTVAKEGFHVGPRHTYGAGVYYGSPTVAAEYAFDGKTLESRADVLSGDVAVGEVTKQDLQMEPKADTRFIPRGRSFGDFWLTKDPKRFKIKAITTYQPDKATGFEKMIPDLLIALGQYESWAKSFLGRIDPEALQRALKANLASENPKVREGAQRLLAQKGAASQPA